MPRLTDKMCYFWTLINELLTTVLAALQLSSREDKSINARTSSSNSIPTELNCVVTILSSLICCATDAPSVIRSVNNRLIKWSLFEAKGFSYMLERAFIRLVVVFSFAMLKATFRDNDNRTKPSACLPRRFHSSSFIKFGFFSVRGWCSFSDTNNLWSASSKSQSPHRRIF